ncbi:MAG: YceI family protein [Egibacteraceae bacterium]
MSVTTSTEIPGYLAGTWAIDPAHSDVSFTVRHMMVSKVRCRFRTFEGRVVTGANPLDSTVTASIDLASVDTNNEQRDAHIRSADFFDVETYPTMTYRSTGVRAVGHGFVIDGELSLHGATKPVALSLEVNGFGPDPWGGTRAGFSATAQISRRDFGIDIAMPMDGGGVVVGDQVRILLELEAVLQRPNA